MDPYPLAFFFPPCAGGFICGLSRFLWPQKTNWEANGGPAGDFVLPQTSVQREERGAEKAVSEKGAGRLFSAHRRFVKGGLGTKKLGTFLHRGKCRK